MHHGLRVKLFVLGGSAGLTAAALAACSIDIDGTASAPLDSGPSADVTVPRLDGSPLDATRADVADVSVPDSAPTDAAAGADADAGDAGTSRDGGPYAGNNAALFSGDPAGFINAARTLVTDDFTLEAWISPTAIADTAYVYDGNQVLVADVSGSHADWSSFLYTPRIGTTPVLAFITGYASGSPDALDITNQAIATSTWTHIAIVRSRAYGQVLFYLDGKINVNDVDASTDSLDAGMYMAVGGSLTGGGTNGFVGLIDEVRVWSYDRAATDIAGDLVDQLSDAEASDPRLVLYYKFDESGNPATVHDSSPSHLDGTIVGDAGQRPTFVAVTGR
jgi:hypothetical protein